MKLLASFYPYSLAPENRKGKVTTKPEEQKGENPTEMQSQTPPMDEVDLVGKR